MKSARPAHGATWVGATSWLRPSTVEGWRRLSYHLEANTADTVEKALVRLRAGYATAGFDYESAQRLLDAVGPAGRDAANCYRAVIDAVASGARPQWLALVPRGRSALSGVVDEDTLCCFERAGLMHSQPDAAAIELLDKLAQLARGAADVGVMDSARLAERLTMELETRRCSALQGAGAPEWISLNDNGAGYDVLSTRLSQGRLAPKLIEVKSSRSQRPRLYLTRNEWEVGRRSPQAWIIHFWDMRSRSLTELSWTTLEAHVPRDQGGGSWSVVIVDVESCGVRAADL